MKVEPLFDRVLLKKQKPKETISSKIVLPSSVEDKSSIAVVAAIGNGLTENGKIEMQVKVGQKVLFTKYAGSEIKIDEEDFIVIKQTDILAILEDN